MNLNELFKSVQGGEGGIINSGMASFIYGLISQWYLVIAIPAMTVTYNVLKALEERGVLKTIMEDLKNSIDAIVVISSTCPQKIVDIQDFFNCLGW
jgi:hypothetical protein